MRWCKQQCCNSQQNRPTHNSANQEDCGWNDGQGQCFEYTFFLPADDPENAVYRNQQSIQDEIQGEGLVGCPAKPSPRNVEDHESEAAESANLFHQLDSLVPVIVSKPVLAANRKDNVGNHDDGYENQTKRIKPFHIKDQPPCYQPTVFPVFILTFGMLKVNNNVKTLMWEFQNSFSQF